ncbi:MAG: hypothetical protein H7Z72_11465 [Bacteroidetes bacterium]|nr:hypothetical protein [Fibrella sp.]
MNRADVSQLIQQRWLHSHEEDSPTERVYRPASYPFPRSRGRSGFDLKPGQALEEIGPGANDAPTATTGSWDVDEQNNLLLHGETDTRLLIISAEADRLVVGKDIAVSE